MSVMTELGIAHDIGGLAKMAEEEASASQEGLATEDAAILDCTRSESLVHTTAESLDPVVAPSSPKGQRVAEVQEGGLKRSFANLGATDITAAQAAARRPHIKADRPDTNSPEADASQEASMTNTDEKLREGFPMADLPIAGLSIGTGWEFATYGKDGSQAHSTPKSTALTEQTSSLTVPQEELDRLQLMQMQLSDRQSSHAQASTTSAPSRPVMFRKATSPDIPEPPHKKGSGQGSSLEGQKMSEHQLRRKLPEGVGRKPPSTPPHSPPTGNRHLNGEAAMNGKLNGQPGRNWTQPCSPTPSNSDSDSDISPKHRPGTSSPFSMNGSSKYQGREKGQDMELQAQLRLAGLLGSRGKLEAALRIAEQLYERHHQDPDVLCLRGQCFAALNRRPQGYAAFIAALKADPEHIESLISCGNLQKGCLQLQEAVNFYRKAHAAGPKRKDVCQLLSAALTDLGTKVKISGRVDEGSKLYEEAIEICDSYGPAYYNLGVVHSEAKEYDKALECYDNAIQAQPSHAEAHCNKGVILKNQGRLEEAIAAYHRALEATPDFQIVQTNLAIALTEKATLMKNDGKLEESLAVYEEALLHQPRHAEALYNLAVAYGECRQLRRAALMYEMTLVVSPDCAEAHNNLGVIHRELNNCAKAMQCYLAALQIKPNFPQALNNVAVIYTSQGKSHDGHQLLMAAIAACPSYAEAYNNLGVLQRDVGAVKEAIVAYDKCLEIQPDSRNAGQNRLLALNYVHPGEDPMVCTEHQKWGDDFQSQFEQLPAVLAQERADKQRLVIGYMSPDLFTHSVSYFAEAPLTHHNPDRISVIAYDCTPTCDAKTQRLKAAVEAAKGTWRNVAKLSEQDLAAQIRKDGVDILVELTGHTANNRLGVMAQRPAPVQVTWIGYPNSTGLAIVDYRFTDMVADPINTEQTFVEELIRLPGCFLCYTPAHDAPPVGELPAAESGFITFGSFNALAKITPAVIAIWAKLLHALPTSRLLLKNKPSACAIARSHFLSQMEAHGVLSERIDLLPLNAGNRDHLATYNQMDISLDPWPYAGTTTTCESLYMGVPVVSLAGGCHAHNVGASLLTTLGLQNDWVAETEEGYIALALRGAQNVKQLAELRAGLRERMLSSPLCDGPGFVKQLEDTYEGLWERWLKEGSAA